MNSTSRAQRCKKKARKLFLKLDVLRLSKGVFHKVIIMKNAIYWWHHSVKLGIQGSIRDTFYKAIAVKNSIYWWYYNNGGIAYFITSAYVTIFFRKLQKDGYGLEKFVLVTRGRTGSTAVIDELNKSRQLHVFQELFIRGDFAGAPHDRGKDGDYYSAQLPPFDHWKPQEKWWRRMIPVCCRDGRQAHKYLMWVEELARRQNIKGMGWKLLSHQFKERPYLANLLKKHGYRVIYLRRNIVSQVLSGMVAKQRGIYNSLEKILDERRFHINVDEFQNHVKIERYCVKIDCAQLNAGGFNFTEVNYEDYCDNREEFFSKIFNFLNLPLELPPPSDFVKMIKNPSTVIENHDEIKAIVAEMIEISEMNSFETAKSVNGHSLPESTT